MGIAESIDMGDENVLCMGRPFIFDTERSCFDDVTVFHGGSSEKPGAWSGGSKGDSGRHALRFMGPFGKDPHIVHVNEEVDRQEI